MPKITSHIIHLGWPAGGFSKPHFKKQLQTIAMSYFYQVQPYGSNTADCLREQTALHVRTQDITVCWGIHQCFIDGFLLLFIQPK